MSLSSFCKAGALLLARRRQSLTPNEEFFFDKDLTGFQNLLGLDTSRTRRVINFVFAVLVVGGYYNIMVLCHPDLPAAGRL